MSKLGATLTNALAIVFATVAASADEDAAEVFDSTKWTKRAAVDFQMPKLGPVRALLLRAVSPTGTSGMGDPLFTVSVMVVAAGHRIVQHYTPLRVERSYHVNDYLVARDVTGDGQPEVLFDSGNIGASSSAYVHHVLHVPEGEQGFWDIAPEKFVARDVRRFAGSIPEVTHWA